MSVFLKHYARFFGVGNLIALLTLLAAVVPPAHAGAVFEAANAASTASNQLDAVKSRGVLNCGVDADAPGFSKVDRQGQWHGLDVEFCAAIASAVLGDSKAVKYFAINAGDQYKLLASGDVDVLMRASAWTLSRDTEFAGRFVNVLYYDGGTFLARRSHSITSVLELSGASVCVLGGSAGQKAVVDFFDSKKMRYQLVISDRWEQLVQIYADAGCTVLYGDQSALADVRQTMASPGEHAILPELITKEPLGPVIRTGDERWFSIVRWVLMAMIAAEELDISKDTVGDVGPASPLDVRRFAGIEIDHGAPLGLSREWALQIVRQVGNFKDVFERTLGAASPLKLERGMNALWRNGGLLYAMPIR